MSAPERRLTQFPGSSSTTKSGTRRFESEREARLSASKIPKVPEFLQSQSRNPPPAIPLKVNPSSQQFLPTSRFSKKTETVTRKPNAILQNGNPWRTYYAILSEDQAGQVTVAYKNEIEHPMFAIKEHVCKDSESVKQLVMCSHKNIVALYDAYLDNDSLYLIYECLQISLAEVQSTQYGDLATFQIAAVCREVCKYLVFDSMD